MFNVKLFGYDRDEVEETLELLNQKIDCQQGDIDYLRKENKKLRGKIKQIELEENER